MKDNIKKSNFTYEDIGRVSRNAEYLKSAENIKLDYVDGKTQRLETPNIYRLTTDETALIDNQGTVNISTEQGLGIKGLYSKDNENNINTNSNINTKENVLSQYQSKTNYNKNANTKRMLINMNCRKSNISVKNYDMFEGLPNYKGNQWRDN